MLNSLVRTSALVALALGAVACVVPATRYDEARSALALEQRANRMQSARLYELEAQVASLQADLDKRQHQIDDQGQKIAQTQLDTDIASRKEQDAEETVEQLKTELERVGDHLRAFAAQRDDAEARAKRLEAAASEASERARVVRDLSLLLHDAVATGEIELDMSEGRPVLRVSAARLLDDSGNVRPEAQPWLAAVARATRLHPGSRVSIAERGRGEGETEAQSTLHLRNISDALAAAGLAASRVTLDVPPAAPSDSTSAPVAAKQAPADAKASLPAQAIVEIAIETEPQATPRPPSTTSS